MESPRPDPDALLAKPVIRIEYGGKALVELGNPRIDLPHRFA